jgi:hypothetical protein
MEQKLGDQIFRILMDENFWGNANAMEKFVGKRSHYVGKMAGFTLSSLRGRTSITL